MSKVNGTTPGSSNSRGGPGLPDLRLGAAIGAAKLASLAVRRARRGGGTALPGLVADRIDPALLTKLTGRLSQGAIVVAGTNGKTTTSRMLADVLEADGAQVVHNRSGSNLVRGVAAAFAAQATIGGNPRGQIGVIETDEAAFPDIVRRVRPRLVLLNNLFRDQLDRYGELNTIATAWQAALATLPPEATVVVNVDDPALAGITEGLRARRVSFGLTETHYTLPHLGHAVDSATCRRCGHDLAYDALYSSHLGNWNCPNCGNARPALDVAGHDIRLDGAETLGITVTVGDGRDLAIEAGVPGLYNAYNVLAATAVANAAGVPDATIQAAFKAFRSAFGRIERAKLDGRTLTLALIKNPVGCNEVLRMLTHGAGTGDAASLAVPTLIAINDRDADGRDVSWLWDADFELLAAGDAPLFTSGIRGADMANRLKYAGVAPDRITTLPPEPAPAIAAFTAALPPGGTGYILPTYTAMLDLRKVLADRGAVESFWRQ